MKFPNHIMLDVSKSLITYTSQYWIYKYLFNLRDGIDIFNSLVFHRKFLFRKDKLLPNKLIENQKKFTIRYSLANQALFLSEEEKTYYKNSFKTRFKVKHRVLYSKHWGKEIYDFLMDPDMLIDEKYLNRLLRNFYRKPAVSSPKNNKLWNLFDINFLKKERIYTKLKYSRVPQYDIVSGGAAALLAGFLGFLICEKFGFEMVDSGDFYFLFMYIVFLIFALRPFFKITSGLRSAWSAFSIKWFVYFCQIILNLFINFFKYWSKKQL